MAFQDEPAAPAPKPGPGVKAILKPLASLQLTVVLFALGMGLVFFGTLAQMNDGIWTVVEQYFWSMVVWVPFDLFAKFGQVFFFLPTNFHLPGSFPFPAGKLLGFAMLANLLAAHAVRFRVSWRRAGILVVHSGLILLFIGEAITRTAQVEQRMIINEGESVNFSEDNRRYELAFVRTLPDGDQVTAVPQSRLVPGERISHPDLPVDLEVLEYMANSELAKTEGQTNVATAGAGKEVVAKKLAIVSGVDMDKREDVPSMYVRFHDKATGADVGTYLFSRFLKPEPLTFGNEKMTAVMRNIRYYKPFTIHLIDFRHDKYTGTDSPKNYSSDVRLIDTERGVDRVQRIAMNEPLRHRGEAFYQHSFDRATEAYTVLQVVRNPGWVIPYISCLMVGLGLTVHFGMYLVKFLQKRSLFPVAGITPDAEPAVEAGKWLPWGILGLAVVYVLAHAGRMYPPSAPYDLAAASNLPVIDGGRVKPLDTFARVSLRIVSGRETFKDEDGNSQPAIRWFFDLATSGTSIRSKPAGKYKVLKIENDQVLAVLGLEQRSGFLYAINELVQDKFEKLIVDARAARKKRAEKQPIDLYESKAIEVANRLELILAISTMSAPLVIHGEKGEDDYSNLPDAIEGLQQAVAQKIMTDNNLPTGEAMKNLPPAQLEKLEADMHREVGERIESNPGLRLWTQLLRAYATKKPDDFNKLLAQDAPGYAVQGVKLDTPRMKLETFYNAFAPFFVCIGLYVGVILLCIASWFGHASPFRKSAFWLMLFTAAIHGTSLIARMAIQDRWLVFVTNLYSSAIFIGFGCVVLCLLLEKIYSIGIGNLLGATLGVLTTIVAHQIGAGGDTLEMMQAVLDTNFWLATHVTCVTFGYTATFVAGALGVAYVIAGLCTRAITPEMNRAFNNMLYGVVAFATLLSFVGTVLGGIWADQSWGRFWGWDPKENGAVLIVIWNSLILHARWAGLVKTRGIALLTIVGNMVTVWSWFGTNQLGIGLHAYGFDNTLAMVCTGLWVSHALLVCVGLIPQEYWMSSRPQQEAVAQEAAPPKFAPPVLTGDAPQGKKAKRKGR
ncbi:cytochrome c biogenesis protein [Limnoglobus roseus]|uniref:Cytochrome c-type biogenesis protein n=1 Tax=Limnoglobus roseus TaxID=2598579 RepID=A0A5C1A9I4_9BACT|nr:cytochrome c biogenesis protein ResB [Limnoglobus roseus]QEL15861.1 cytochrome c-type biogenesis protein [Limnoglobus roseus]